MQSLDVISANLWQILISLLNLVLLFLIMKYFLFKPVKRMLVKRQAELDERYNAADTARKNAEDDELYWKEKRKNADAEADAVMKTASDNAKLRGDKIITDAKNTADDIIRRAEEQAELEKKKAAEDIKREIVNVSTVLAEKMLSREINADDHRDIIDSVIEKIGDSDDK